MLVEAGNGPADCVNLPLALHESVDLVWVVVQVHDSYLPFLKIDDGDRFAKAENLIAVFERLIWRRTMQD
jgi:hypothetical protein